MSASHHQALVFGKNGQLAWELLRTVPDGWDVTALGSAEIDLLDPAQIADAFGSLEPDLVINAAAYTAVDKAETESERAFDLNQCVVKNIVEQLQLRPNVAFIHVSTDFVFDGKKAQPYKIGDATAPLGIYGASKLAGEREIIERSLHNSLILRTSWVYSSHGQNFVKTMLRLMSDPSREELSIVYDQVGTPTWGYGLAKAIWRAGEMRVVNTDNTRTEIHHWTDAGVASWYDFAVAIQELAIERGLLDRKIAIRPIPHTDYPTPATRPAFSVLDKSHFEASFQIYTKHWREQLASMLDELKS
ncbi:dTDP-4-dehydrorhamnose reductase [Microbulbifer bruguierae]|uniref:dTDP-4-dehydrorhamnose reductase n=1 Tax=Microbulbifer bruguierae TaxID=3029061 RepID=A0ABY8NFX1_9GAMM|nr:dTDP-4-dehydrorhamnose reductase [Microbulbifer bruguierae]WGL17299.1 dTDP-4-dehydrorhamnose reductase [Microbulbifer bruguierae]